MLTTIVIGNRYTQRKRNFIFTPRGYNDWASAETHAAENHLPENALWVFSGTSDGNALASELAREGHPVVISTATEYGGEVATKDCPGIAVWAGSRGLAARKKALTRSRARVLVDATHPYASAMSEQLMELSCTLGTPYLRYERPSARTENSGELCASMEQAAARAIALGKRIFLATGSKDLATFLQAPGAEQREWFVRLTPEPTFMQRAIDLGMPRSHICAMQGPFSQEHNVALWRDWQIDCVVTKDSGNAGGYQAKVAAAHALGIPVLVIQRPTLAYPIVVSTFDAVLQQLQAWDITA